MDASIVMCIQLAQITARNVQQMKTASPNAKGESVTQDMDLKTRNAQVYTV